MSILMRNAGEVYLKDKAEMEAAEAPAPEVIEEVIEEVKTEKKTRKKTKKD